MPFDTFPTWVNALIFVGAAVVVYTAGTRLATYADGPAREPSNGGVEHSGYQLPRGGAVFCRPTPSTVAGRCSRSWTFGDICRGGWGRRDRDLSRRPARAAQPDGAAMGLDSLAVLVVYGTSLVVLYTLR